MKKLGAHLSIAGGYTKPLQKIKEIGGNCLQIFSSSPRTWESPKVAPDQIKSFVEMKEKLHIHPVYFHAPYLINLASSETTGKHSKRILIDELKLAKEMGVKGSIVHLGSFKESGEEGEVAPEVAAQKYDVLINNIKEVLAATPPETLFIIENAGNRKIGLTLDEIAKIIKNVDDKRVRVCFDTCHLHAAGYTINTQEHLDKFLDIVKSFIGLDKIELWHMNDSKDAPSSRRDRHENIGKGHVGIEAFSLLLNHPVVGSLPFIIETPGFDEKGPDKENLDILKGLIAS